MFTVIEETPDFIIVDKAAGAHFHSQEGCPGVFESIKQSLSLTELYPVHRLDSMTSGVLLLAKNKATAASLGQQFEQRLITKFYLALSDKKPKKKQGLIKGDMQPARRGSYKLLKSSANPAITQFFSQSIGEGKRVFLLRPHTGKTHQLRVAMKSLGASILGDKRYTGSDADRGYLHAWYLRFELSGKSYRYTSSPTQGQWFTSAKLQLILQQEWSQPELLSWPNIK